VRRTVVIAAIASLAACAHPRVPAFTVSIPAGQSCSAVLSAPELERQHIEPPQKGRYNTDPPTSGIHYSIFGTAPAPVGVYDKPLPDEYTVHNLEHGHVVVQYRALTKAELTLVRAAAKVDPQRVVVAPRPTMKWKLALTAWTKIQVCDRIPPNAAQMIATFIRTRELHAPESIPPR
jgi:hypothetical protein